MKPFVLSVVTVAALAAGRAWAQQPPSQPAAAAGPVPAAFVNGEPITVTEIEAAYQSYVKGRQLNPREANETKANLLKSAIDNRLVAQAFERDQTLATKAEVDKQMEALRSQVEKDGKTLEDLTAAQGLTIESLRKGIILRLASPRYFERKLTSAIQEYFGQHKQEFDGTELRVSHIILRPDQFNETRAHVEERAAKIRQEIAAGKLSFADAAKQYSDGPSREKGGDLGYMPRFGVMTEDFAKVAFSLKQGEVSQPVTTAFGTHLITVTDMKPGDKKWTDVIPQIRNRAAQDLMVQLANQERESAKIEYTGRTPYFKPGTDEVVVETPGETP